VSIRALVLPVLLSSLPLLAACGGIDNGAHVGALQAIAAEAPPWVDKGALGKQLWSATASFYEARGHVPAWIDGNRSTPQLDSLLQALRAAEQHGLDPERYGLSELTREVDSSQTMFGGTRFEAERVPELDARLTYAYLQYAADLLGWTTDPRQIHPDWAAPSRKEDLAVRLAEAIAADAVGPTLDALAPTHPQYKGLQVALAEERTNTTGRLEQIRMNLERWRWAPRDFGDRHVLVNIPTYQLQVIEGEEPVLSMRVIVGEPDHGTPVFSDEMTYLVFSPYWNIPESILREETLPKVVEDPEYLSRNRIEVLQAGKDEQPVDPESIDWSNESETKGLRFRQEPGPENALGRVKFIFPNHFAVYLHDTPATHLFGQEHRALSHGCVRVEDPVALAEYVLRERDEWSADRIRQAMNADEEATVRLKNPLPVHLGYWTAWVEPDGRTVTYTADPYGIDQAHARVRGVTLDAAAE
jgi:murein L,D-transpeptidase YcbB/YkuD